MIIPLTPIRVKEGLLYPLQIDLSWRWGNEIMFLLENNLIKHISVHGYIRYKAKKIFSEYI